MIKDNGSDDKKLLRRFEPLIRYTRGEKFYPTDVDRYVAQSSLWVRSAVTLPDCLVPEGELTLEKLAEIEVSGNDTVEYLQFIEPLDVATLASYRLQEVGRSLLKRAKDEERFHVGLGRMARVGYLSRFVGGLFALSLLARGRVPGDHVVAAALTYRQMQAEDEHYVYYGRVVRQAGWVILQYWFFYVFNDWRSSYFGANDHEADWEMINIYLSETKDGKLEPEWVAYASHDFSGDDLRRRWDDPEVEKVGEHPVIYVAAGSHASYFSAGEYLAEMELPFLAPLVRLVDRWQAFWRRVLNTGRGRGSQGENRLNFNVFRIPFVDYARGDGLSIGPRGEKTWDEPILIEPPPSWVVGYRGLWGYFARDPIAGENAPGGPRYNRDGSVRRVWYDPVGWAGLDKVPPPNHLLDLVAERRAEILVEQEVLRQQIELKQKCLYDLSLESSAMYEQPHLRKSYYTRQAQIATVSAEVAALREHLIENETLLAALQDYGDRLHLGDWGDPRAHIRRMPRSESEISLRIGKITEVWAAVSISLMLIAIVALAIFAHQYLIFGLAAITSLIVFVEASFRRQLDRLITSLTIGLAVAAALILLFEFFWQIVVAVVLFAGGYILWENLRELWG